MDLVSYCLLPKKMLNLHYNQNVILLFLLLSAYESCYYCPDSPVFR